MKRPDNLINILDVYTNVRLSAEDASKLHDWINHIESQLQPRKTVSDAVSAYPEGYETIPRDPSTSEGFEQLVLCAIESFDDEGFGYESGKIYQGSVGFNADYFYQVCTREEFEAEVERRKGGEVFRLVGSSDLVKVVYEGRDGIVCVANEDNDIFVVKKEDLRKRKPISKAEAWDKAVSEDVSPFYILENYEVK